MSEKHFRRASMGTKYESCKYFGDATDFVSLIRTCDGSFVLLDIPLFLRLSSVFCVLMYLCLTVALSRRLGLLADGPLLSACPIHWSILFLTFYVHEV